MNSDRFQELGKLVPRSSEDVNDDYLIDRICRAYRYSNDTFGDFQKTGRSQWTELNGRKQAIHQALLTGQGVHKLFRTPGENSFFEGYDSNFSGETSRLRDDSDFREFSAALVYEGLERMLRNLGLMRMRNPEAPDRNVKTLSKVDDMTRMLANKLGISLTFPNPFPGEYGINGVSGVISIRAVYALYQAYMTRLLMTHSTRKAAVEIGAGLGRAAYFSFRLGISDYTIYDLPLTNAAQAYFLGITLGSDQITLSGEQVTGSLKILSPSDLKLEQSDGVGVVACVDALTEMEYETAYDYVNFATQVADVFFTVNHEVNDFTASEIIRALCPNSLNLHYEHGLRPGYVEDIVFNRSM